ncbi:hypothetical protein Peur_013464 [Populus x canadensis]
MTRQVHGSKVSIYRVPHYLREGDEKAHAPQIVSLLEEKARSCYEGPIILSSNEFVEMMVLDGCFVLELFRGVAEGFKKLGYPRNDPVFVMRCSMYSIQIDMIMLENQLPLFVLDRLLGLKFNNPDQKGLEAHRALIFFDLLMPTGVPLTESERNSWSPLWDMPLLLTPCLIKEACSGLMFFGEVCCEQGLNLCPEIGSGGGQKLIVLLISDASNNPFCHRDKRGWYQAQET